MAIFETTEAEIMEGTNGICLACGEVHYGDIEPDAVKYTCEACNKPRVYGLELALLKGRLKVV